jgi:hypothetical protein
MFYKHASAIDTLNFHLPFAHIKKVRLAKYRPRDNRAPPPHHTLKVANNQAPPNCPYCHDPLGDFSFQHIRPHKLKDAEATAWRA